VQLHLVVQVVPRPTLRGHEIAERGIAVPGGGLPVPDRSVDVGQQVLVVGPAGAASRIARLDDLTHVLPHAYDRSWPFTPITVTAGKPC
jgi:hypothetical protein